MFLINRVQLSSSISFNEWYSEHERIYVTVKEKTYREKIFNDNLRLIEKLNIQHRERLQHMIDYACGVHESCDNKVSIALVTQIINYTHNL